MRNFQPNQAKNSQIQQPGQGLPSLQAGHWPQGGFDPRGYFPDYQPGGNSNPYAKSDFLSLPSRNQLEIFFGDFYKVGEPPQPWILTVAPSPANLLGLALQDGPDPQGLDLYYKVEYVFDSGYPSYWDGSFDQSEIYTAVDRPGDPTPVLAAAVPPPEDGYKQLPQRGIRLQLRGWAFKLWVLAVGVGTRGANWSALGPGGTPLTVRVDASISMGGQEGANTESYEIGRPTEYLPTFSRAIRFPNPSGGAGLLFAFQDLAENGIITYPVGSDFVPIPARATKVVSVAVPPLLGEVILY